MLRTKLVNTNCLEVHWCPHTRHTGVKVAVSVEVDLQHDRDTVAECVEFSYAKVSMIQAASASQLNHSN